MSKLAFCDCGITFDSSQGHICDNDTWIPGTMRPNIVIPTFDDELISLDQNFRSFTVEQKNDTQSGDANHDYLVNTSLNSLASHSHDQLAPSHQAYQTGGMSSDFANTSQQAYSEEYARSAPNSHAFFHNNEVLTSDYNLPMSLTSPNFHTSLSISQLPTMECQNVTNEDNLTTYPNTESYNKESDFPITNTLFQQMPRNEFQTINEFEDFQTQTNIQSDQFKLMNNHIAGFFGCQNRGIRNNLEVNDGYWGIMDSEESMRNFPQNIRTESRLQPTDVNHPFSEFRENTREIQTEGSFAIMTNHISIREEESRSCLIPRDIYTVNTTHDSATYNVPPLIPVRQNRTNTENIQSECNYAITDYETDFNDVTLKRCREDAAVKGISTHGQSESVVDHSINKDHTVAGPSHMHLNESNFHVSVEGKQQNAVHNPEKRFICNVCHKGFTKSYYLKRHMLIHSGQKPYECEKCGRSFRHKCALKTHELVHLGAKEFQCDICKHRFNQRPALLYHMRIHDGKRPYLCEICGLSFRLKSELRIHSCIHTGEELFECEFCRRKYLRKSSLYQHKKIHKH